MALAKITLPTPIPRASWAPSTFFLIRPWARSMDWSMRSRGIEVTRLAGSSKSLRRPGTLERITSASASRAAATAAAARSASALTGSPS